MSLASEPTDLQFDRADFAGGQTAAPTCAVCQHPIARTYFEINGQVACAGCHDTLARAHEDGTAGPLGLIKAIGAGTAAGIAGAILYYAVAALTGYELGLIAVAVGFMVGGAVRWGSGGRGGLTYQVIAVSITYLSIVSTYVPFLFEAARKAPSEASAPAAQSAVVASSAPAAPAPDASADEPVTAAQAAVGLVILFGIILALPFLAGFSNIMGWLIIGFALFEAWKVNRRVRLAIAGPFTLTASEPPPAGVS